MAPGRSRGRPRLSTAERATAAFASWRGYRSARTRRVGKGRPDPAEWPNADLAPGWRLLGAQRDQRVDAGRPAGRDERGRQAGDDEERGHGNVGDRVDAAQAEKERAEQPRAGERG